MSAQDAIHSVRDLVHYAADAFGEQDSLRYIENDQVGSVTFNQFRDKADAIAAWTVRQNKKLGRKVRVAMLSPNNALYAVVMLGVMCGGGVSVPMDPQITHKTLCNCLNKAEVDIILHDKAIKLDRKGIYNTCKSVERILYIGFSGLHSDLDGIE